MCSRQAAVLCEKYRKGQHAPTEVYSLPAMDKMFYEISEHAKCPTLHRVCTAYSMVDLFIEFAFSLAPLKEYN